MLKKKQVITLVSIAIISFLVGTTFNVITIATDSSRNPWDMVWEAFYDLEAQVQSLNQTVHSLNQNLENLRPEIVTAYNPTIIRLLKDRWIDTVSILNVELSEGTTVLAIATMEIACDHGLVFVRANANNTYSTVDRQGDTGWQITEVHYVWQNLTSGTYTFAIQCKLYLQNWGWATIRRSRLTLVIF